MNKTKKWLCLGLAAVLVFSPLSVPALAADGSQETAAVPVQYTLSVDGAQGVSLWAYEIDGGVYFKLRDLAMALNGTGKQFDVTWDDENKEVDVVKGESYTPVGGELTQPVRAGSVEARYTDYSIRSAKGWGNILAYLVDDSNYVKLSDLASVLGFASSFDSEQHTVAIDTSPEAVAANEDAASNEPEDALDNIALLGAGNSYFLDEDGNVILHYLGSKTKVATQLNLREADSGDDSRQSVDDAGFYISEKKTAIAYGGLSGEPVYVITSEDMGKTWETSEVIARNVGVSKLYVGFNTPQNGWLVISNFHGMGHEDHYIYLTFDGGKTWTQIGNPNELYARVATGAGFSSDRIGFLNFRYETDFQPAIVRTLDGGYTWKKLYVTLPAEFDDYSKTPLSPVFRGAQGLYPIRMSSGGDGSDFTIYLVSDDHGKTWTYSEEYSLAAQWGEAVKNRDGRAQYALMSKEFQAKSYDDYQAFDWVTGASSPWVQGYTVRLVDGGAALTYRWASSTGLDGISIAMLTFVREDGALRIAGVEGTNINDEYERFGLIVPLPEGYAGKVTLKPRGELSGAQIIAVYQTATYVKYPGAGRLFSIVRHTPAEFEHYWPAADAIGGVKHFAKDNGYYYSVETPTDVQADVETEGTLEEYEKLFEEINTSVLPAFIEANGLTSYDHSAIYESEYTYPGNHAIFTFSLSSGSKYRLVLSQPVRQGEGGIWCADRMYDEYGNVYIAMPKTDLIAAKYYTQLQAEVDAGHRVGLLDPEDVAFTYLADEWNWAQHVSEHSIEYVADGD